MASGLLQRLAGPLVFVGVCAGLVAAGTKAASESRDARPATESLSSDDQREFMRKKLVMVQSIVEGLATDDFEKLAEGSEQLLLISETAEWNAGGQQFYHYYSGNFQQAVKGLRDAAESKSIEKATYAWIHVTMSCTACHQHVRNEVRVAR